MRNLLNVIFPAATLHLKKIDLWVNTKIFTPDWNLTFASIVHKLLLTQLCSECTDKDTLILRNSNVQLAICALWMDRASDNTSHASTRQTSSCQTLDPMLVTLKVVHLRSTMKSFLSDIRRQFTSVSVDIYLNSWFQTVKRDAPSLKRAKTQYE